MPGTPALARERQENYPKFKTSLGDYTYTVRKGHILGFISQQRMWQSRGNLKILQH